MGNEPGFGLNLPLAFRYIAGEAAGRVVPNEPTAKSVAVIHENTIADVRARVLVHGHVNFVIGEVRGRRHLGDDFPVFLDAVIATGSRAKQLAETGVFDVRAIGALGNLGDGLLDRQRGAIARAALVFCET